MSTTSLLAPEVRFLKFAALPLEKLRMNQPFGVNWIGSGKYAALGIPSDAHNGFDLMARRGTEINAPLSGQLVIEGSVNDRGYGLVARLFHEFAGGRYRIEIVNGHLLEGVVPNDRATRERPHEVAAGDRIALADNSGSSTADHLHFGTRFWQKEQGGAWRVVDYGNGYHGYVDPTPFFPDDVWVKDREGRVFALPIDKRYGNAKNPLVPTEYSFYGAVKFFREQTNRLPTKHEYNALRFGFWDLRTVLDPTRFWLWGYYSKPEAKAKKLIE